MNNKKDNAINNDQMKVLGLQELAQVAGGRAADWSTDSIDCGTVQSNEWSTLSRGCRTLDRIEAK
ncbi:hypothetical protein [Pleionea sp. CnH1-48]|uniref:hypothetical protein n=1 Tax=Pleionea sp. CnH1-48 TaxID=2954494 RepID=UPI00209688EE|nr:hypothetical protein [Pleionea sp. CnH1-48]MCO7226650.1 hypothetical protein [Pleionea sp. CnH1-48]MCO7226651.1 hypothetical protein [Pleionea sp. CnH1-48]